MVLHLRFIRQWLASFTAALCMAIAATGFTWLTPIAVQFINEENSPIPMTELQRSWISACTSIGNTLSCIPVGIMAHRWGRKPILLLAGPLSLIGWILLIFTRSLSILYIVGLLQGYVMATAFTICSIYIAEIATAEIRGALCGQFMTLYYLGTIYVDIAAYFTTYNVYLWILALLPALYTIIFYFMPETPNQLLLNGNIDKTIASLTWLNPRNDFYVNLKFLEIKSSIQKKFYWKDFIFIKHNRKALIIIIIAYCLKCFSGQISLQIYTTQILTEITDYGLLLTIILNTILCLTCFISGFISDILGRRPVMYITSFLSGIFNLIIAIYFIAYDSNISKYSNINQWIIFTSMALALTLGNASMSIFLPTVMAEYFSTEARPIGSAIAHAIAGIAASISILIYQYIKDSIGDYFNYLIFTFCSFIASAVIYYCVKETARKTLESIQSEVQTD